MVQCARDILDMFDKKKQVAQDQSGFAKPTQDEPASLKNVKVLTIPHEFYDGGLGDGVAHGPEKTPIVPSEEVSKAVASVQPSVSPVAASPKKLELDAQASSQLTHGGGHKSLIIGGLIGVILLAAAGAFAYWWFVVRSVPVIVPIVSTPVETTAPDIELEPVPSESEPVPETEPAPIVPVYPVGLREYQLSVDSDLDSLTDSEEREIYGSDPMRPDDDSDGFVDGHEVFHLYNPAARAPVALADSGLVSIHENVTFGYRVYYPRVWASDSVDADGQDTLFTSATGELMEILVHPNEDELQLAEWYAQRTPAVTADRVRSISTKRGLVALLSPDSLSMYIARGQLVYELRYDIGVRVDANFMRTFVMMQNSFEFTTQPLYVPDEIPVPTQQSGVEPTTSMELFQDNELVEPIVVENGASAVEIESVEDVSSAEESSTVSESASQ